MDYMLYSLRASLQKFSGERGFQRMLDAGRLSLLSFLGEFEASQDEVFARRSDAVMRTRQCLMNLNELFDTVDKLGGSLVQAFGRIVETLEEFHKCCDNEAASSTESDSNERDEFELKFKDLRIQNANLKQSFIEFSNLKLTPKRMNLSAIQQVENSFMEASRIVGASQTDLDVHRRRVHVRETDLHKAQLEGEPPAIQFARNRLQDASAMLERAGLHHMEVVKVAMDNTRFALEQTSMASWSSSNVFFAQLGSLFNGFGDSTRAIANICCLIKNMQSVSKKISEEKGKALSEAQAQNQNQNASRHADSQQGEQQNLPEAQSNPGNFALDDLFQ